MVDIIIIIIHFISGYVAHKNTDKQKQKNKEPYTQYTRTQKHKTQE